jgi:RNA polymerase sigma factor (TIGR02999 family)
MDRPPTPLTQLLVEARAGDSRARDRILAAIYDELRSLARAYFQNERRGHTLEPTALANEVCLRLLSGETLPGSNGAQLRAFIARAMRHVLIDHARERQAAKRGGGRRRRRVADAEPASPAPDLDVLALDEALERLAAIDARKGSLVELRYFGGLTVDETADVLGISAATVKREWEVARRWLYRELAAGESRDVD